MKYHFKVGRLKTIIVDENDTFEKLGNLILKAYHIDIDHAFLFVFSNGEETNSGTLFGPMDDYRDVAIDSQIKNRKMVVGEVITMEYNYFSNWKRKVKLVNITE